MDTSSAVEQSGGQSGGSLAPGGKEYALPESSFVKYGASLVFQVAVGGVLAIALAVVAHYVDPVVDWGRITTFSVLVVLAVLLSIPFLLRSQRRLWRQVRVEVGDDSVVVRQGAGRMPDLHLLPQGYVRVERDQVVDIQEASYGLVMVTRYDPEALVITNRLAPADYREIFGTLPQWRPIERRSVVPQTGASQAGTRLGTDLKRAEPAPKFYEQGFWVIPVGLLIGVLAGTLPGVFAILAWAREHEVPRDVAWVILAAYFVNLFVIMLGTPIAFAWLDYGLSLAGLSPHARSSFWIVIGSTVFVFALALALGLDLAVSAIATVIGSMAVGVLYWVYSNIRWRSQPAFGSSEIIAPDSASYAETAGMAAGGPIEGIYRFTYGEYLTANGYFILSQPRSHGRPRLLSALLPRSVPHAVMQATFSAHPLRNKLMRFSVNDDAIRWRIDDSPESMASWDQVHQVLRTRMGLLLCRARRDFDWLPFHAFTAKDGPAALIEVAKRHTTYKEIGKDPSHDGPGGLPCGWD